MSKRSRKPHPDKPSLLFYLFVAGLLGAGIYRQRDWITAHQPHFLIGGAALLFIALLYLVHRLRLAGTLKNIDAMTGHEFERYLVRLFKKLGFQAHNVGQLGGDFGADLIIRKDGITIAVQAKNYLHGRVGNDAVQQAIAGATYYDCDQAMVVTNAKFTKAAKEQARGCGHFPVTLWDRRDIQRALER